MFAPGLGSVFCRPNNTIVDTVLAAPRSSYPDIVRLTSKQVQAGTFSNLKVVPGFYTVATDRGGLGCGELVSHTHTEGRRSHHSPLDWDEGQ